MPEKTKAKKRTKKPGLVRPFNGGTMTEAEFNAFITAALRNCSLRWKPRGLALKRVFHGKAINPHTGKMRRVSKCPDCEGIFPETSYKIEKKVIEHGMKVDHVIPVTGHEGFTGWSEKVRRMFVEVDGYRTLCKTCHDAVTVVEQAERREFKAARAVV